MPTGSIHFSITYICVNSHETLTYFKIEFYFIKGAVMQIEKALINDRFRISKRSLKFRTSTIYNFAVIFTREIYCFLKK